ncbi:MAG: hypothetical protein HPY64_05920 [Anaerolineae bacterium]|nr:hypothetical protein [Anaerolineae bacterium]
MIRSLLDRLALPAWARLENPLVRRELQALPLFLGQDGNLNVKMALLAALGLGLMPCSCSCGGWPWSLLQVALSLIPLLWGALLINRERVAGTWELLRTTPYSDTEIVLAKISAVLYRLSPLLALLLSGQAASFLMTGLFAATVFLSTTVSVNGVPVWPAMPVLAGGSEALPLAYGLAFAMLLLTTVLDFVTNIVIGVLASSLTASRGTAYAGAIGLRVVLSLGWIVLGALGLGLIASPEVPASGLLALSAAAQPALWLILITPATALAPVALLTGLALAAQVVLLIGLFRLVVWRVSRS